MASVMYFGTDDRVSLLLGEFFKNRQEDAGENHTFTHITDDKKLAEALVALSFDLLFFEQNALGNLPSEWLEAFKKKYEKITAPLILCGNETDTLKIMKYLHSGFQDYLVMPADKALLIEKFSLYTTGKRNKDLRQVYSLKMSQPSDIAKPGHIEELSEFDCKVRSFEKMAVDDLALLYSKAFSADSNTTTSIIGRCYQSEEHQGFKGQFLNYFYFLGNSSETLQNIRAALRKAYVNSKQK